MNWDSLSRWGTMIANLGVVAGFVMLALQLQQNTEAMRLQALSTLNSASVTAEGTFAGDTIHLAMANAIYHPSEITPAEMSQVWGYVNMYVNAALNAWYSRDAGQSSEGDWLQAKANVRAVLSFRAGHVIWAPTRSAWPPRFVEEIDAALGEGDDRSTERMWYDIMSDVRKLEPLEPAASHR